MESIRHGVHHISYWVDDITAEAKRLDALGYPGFRDGRPRAAAASAVVQGFVAVILFGGWPGRRGAGCGS